jgi:hypothetical protein
MKKKRYSEERITYALRQAEAGTPVADICRQPGVMMLYTWSGLTQSIECSVRLDYKHENSPI